MSIPTILSTGTNLCELASAHLRSDKLSLEISGAWQVACPEGTIQRDYTVTVDFADAGVGVEASDYAASFCDFQGRAHAYDAVGTRDSGQPTRWIIHQCSACPAAYWTMRYPGSRVV